MKTIIVATDYSDVSQNATRYAAALAKKLQASLLLYHAFYFQETYSDILVVAPTIEELTTEHQARLEAIKEAMMQTYQIPVHCFTSYVPITEELPHLVTKNEAAMVVMGMKNLSLFDRRVFGSVATSIITMAQFPVLLIPEKASSTFFKHILFSYDFDLLSTNNPLLLIKELALAFQAQLYLLHVEKPESAPALVEAGTKKKYTHMERVFQEIPHQYIFLEQDDIGEGIGKAISQYQADLLVMVPQPHGFWERLFNQSLTNEIAFKTTVPLLTLPNPSENWMNKP